MDDGDSYLPILLSGFLHIKFPSLQLSITLIYTVRLSVSP